MSLKLTNLLGPIHFWLIFAIVILGFSITSIDYAEPARSGDGSGVEHWNFKDTGYTPNNPTSNDLITFNLEVNSDSNVSKVEIFICKDNICGLPQEMLSTQANIFTFRNTEKFADGTKVNYRFTIKYSDTEKIEMIPASASTKDAALVLGSLYFEFFIGENWNYKSTLVDPVKPIPDGDITFTLVVDDDSQIKSVSIKIVWDKPEFTENFEQLMEKSGDNTYAFKSTQKFEDGTKVGYRFIIEYDMDVVEPIPTSKSTANVYEEQGELYFGIDVASGVDGIDGIGDNKDDDKDDGGFLPGFEANTTIIAFLFIIVIILGLTSVLSYEKRKIKK